MMMKFFRKHNKKLLAVFMALLMLVFLGGSALDNLLRPSRNRVVAHSLVGDISFVDQDAVDYTGNILSALQLNWSRPLPGMAEPLERIDWVMLTREAKRLGTASTATVVRTSFAASKDFDVDELARALRVKPDDIWRALAEYASVRQTAMTVGAAAIPSEADVLASAQKMLDKVKIQAVLIPASLFVDQTSEFSAPEIEAQYAAHREKEPGSGLAFGYYVPPAVKVQYIRIDRDVIADRLRMTDEALIKKAKELFGERRDVDLSFKRLVDKALTTPNEKGELPFEGPPQDPYLTWDEAKDFALREVRKQEANATAARLATAFIDYAGEAWMGEERGKEGYRQAPAHVAALKYYEEIKGPDTLAYPEAVSVAVTDFFSEKEADEVPLLGKAQLLAGSAPRPTLRTLAFRSQAIVPTIPQGKGVNLTDYLAMFQTCRYPLTDPQGNVYVFRVVAGRPGHVPESVEEVRDRVIADLRLQRAHERALARAESLRSCATDTSLSEAYESDAELVAMKNTPQGGGSGYFDPPPFSRATRSQVLRLREIGNVIIGGGVGGVPSAVAEQCFALAAAADKSAVIELRDRPAAMVVVAVEALPGHVEEFQDVRVSLAQDMSRSRSQDAIASWLDPEQIRARNAFKLATD